MDVDQYAVNFIGNTRAINLERLEDNIAIRKDHGLTPLPDVLNGIERVRIETRGKWVINEEARSGKQAGVAGIFYAVTLESAEIIGIAKLNAQLLKDIPIALLAFRADLLLK